MHASADTMKDSQDVFAFQSHDSFDDFDEDEIVGVEIPSAAELNLADCTMINTKQVIALPGFLKMDYNSDVRPLTILN